MALGLAISGLSLLTTIVTFVGGLAADRWGRPSMVVPGLLLVLLSQSALLLIHDTELRRLLDEWVCQLDDSQFVDMLPLLRRTFGTFAAAERQTIAERIAVRAEDLNRQHSEEIDLELAAPALATVDLILRSHD